MVAIELLDLNTMSSHFRPSPNEDFIPIKIMYHQNILTGIGVHLGDLDPE